MTEIKPPEEAEVAASDIVNQTTPGPTAPDADALLGDPLPQTRPGVLRGGSTLTLETLQGQMLFNGRKREGEKTRIVGLRGFASSMAFIHGSAAKQCPWAYQKLVQIEKILFANEALLKGYIEQLIQRLGINPQLSHVEAHSIAPISIDLNFKTAYAFRGANLLTFYDKSVRLAMSLHHTGMITDRELNQFVFDEGGRAVRQVFEASMGYRYSGVTFEEVRQKTAKALEAIETHGEIEAGILNGDVIPRWAPTKTDMRSGRYAHIPLDLKPRSILNILKRSGTP